VSSWLRRSLTEIGFYTIANHGVPSALVHEVYRQVAQFHARPLDGKRAWTGTDAVFVTANIFAPALAPSTSSAIGDETHFARSGCEVLSDEQSGK
jgi:isopenicillin N synthase-like dioxygenase